MARALVLIALLIALMLAGCGGIPNSGTRNLQARLAATLDDPAQCPSGTSADLQALMIAAGPDGVVQIPAGCYQIIDSVGIPAGRRVFGAGMEGTILYRDPDTSRNGDEPIFWIFGRGEGGTQVSGIAFLGVRDTDDGGEDYGIVLHNSRDFRVDHCYFEGFGFAAVRTEGTSRGVIDHSVFVDNFKRGIDNLGYGVAVYGADEWADDPGAGTADAVFVEDSLFVGSRHAIASNAGAHYVFRYNQVRENVEACSVDAHGLGFGSARGTRYVEIYGNVVEDSVYKRCGIGIRGGDGVIFGNTLRGFRVPILLILEWGTPDHLKASYPAQDQIRDLWIWDNEVQGGPSAPRIDPEAKGFVEPGRDYFTQPKPGYEPYPYPHPLAAGGPFDAGATSP
jgi:hypothetical protein